jgi:SAM-dependent methyltransferase
MFESNPFSQQQKVIQVPLRDSNKEWDEKFSSLMTDNFLSRKYNRARRLNDHLGYLQKLAPEVLLNENSGSYVVDIGPGPGELLEICRALGYKTKGFDAKLEDCEMGRPYLELSMLMSERQDLDIDYCGFENTFCSMPIENDSTFLVNSRGSIEQVFKRHLEGVPHKIHHDASRLAWTFSDDMRNDFLDLFKSVYRILVQGGIFLIYGNGSSNIGEYHDFIMTILGEIPNLRCELTDGRTIHKIRKVR